MYIDVIGAPLRYGTDKPGTDLATAAIRYAGLENEIKNLKKLYNDLGDVKVPALKSSNKDDVVSCINEVNSQIYEKVVASLKNGNLPLVLGGDHSVAIGTGMAVQAVHKNIGVLWIDAHTDFNTFKSSPSGKIHGMPLTTITGANGRSLVPFIEENAKFINPDKCVVIANRSVDEAETEVISKKGIHQFSIADIDVMGIKGVMDKALKIVTKGTNGYHLSFDMDAVTPEEAPGVGTPVRGGLTFREAHLITEMIAETPGLKSFEFVEVNPLFDIENKTGKLAVSLIAAVLGKRFTVPRGTR